MKYLVISFLAFFIIFSACKKEDVYIPDNKLKINVLKYDKDLRKYVLAHNYEITIFQLDASEINFKPDSIYKVYKQFAYYADMTNTYKTLEIDMKTAGYFFIRVSDAMCEEHGYLMYKGGDISLTYFLENCYEGKKK